jgi:hypothetical protein
MPAANSEVLLSTLILYMNPQQKRLPYVITYAMTPHNISRTRIFLPSSTYASVSVFDAVPSSIDGCPLKCVVCLFAVILD